MNLYADTSALIAWFHPADEFAPAVTAWCRQRAPQFSWNPLLRIELRHNLRRLCGKYAAVAWHAYRASETALRLQLGSGTWDFVHVAAAQHARTQAFITCDAAQAALAWLAGLTQVQLFK